MAASQPRTQHSRPFIVAVFVFVRCIDTCYALLLKFFTSGAAGHSTGALVFGLYRNALAVPLLWLAARVLEPKAPWLPTAADAPAVLLLAGSAVAVTQIFYLQGLALTHSMILATALGNLTPVVSAILGGALGTERLGTVKLAGVLLAIAGSLAMVHPSAGELPAARRPFLLGCALLAASPASWAASLFVAKPLLARYPPIVLTAWNFSLGTAVMACAAAGLQGGGDPAIWRVASWREGLALALAATFGCAFKFSAVSWLLFNTEATLLCVFETAGHVGTILATAFVLHEPLLRRYAFAVPVFLGCALVAAAGDWGPPPPPPRAAQQQPDEASALPPGSAAAEEGGLPAGGQDDLRTPLLANGASE